MGRTKGINSSANDALVAAPSGFVSRWWPPFCAIISGIALSFCYPGWNQEGLVWLALAPLLVALWFSSPPRRKRPRRGLAKRLRSTVGWRGFCLGWLAGFAFFNLNLSWILHIDAVTGSFVPGLLGLVSLSAYLALYFALWGAFASTVGRIRVDRLFREVSAPKSPNPGKGKDKKKNPPLGGTDQGAATSAWEAMFISSCESLRAAFLCASAWGGLEWLRGWLFTGFGWNGLGVALNGNLVLIQICDVVGVTGLSFLIVFCLCVGLATVRRLMLEVGKGRARPHLDFAAAILLVILVFFYGLGKRSVNQLRATDLGETTELRVLLVQGDIRQDQKFDADTHAAEIYDIYTTFSMSAALYDLVVWPESALPYVYYTTHNQERLNPLLAKGDFSLLAGSNLIDYEAGQIFNAAILVDGNLLNDPQIYRKMQLVPFGEYIPLKPVFGFVERWLPGLAFSSGISSDPLVLKNPKVNLSTLICFEDTFGRVARKFVRTGSPQLLVNLTNDGWFGRSAAPEQHLVNAVFRCVELRRPMVRATNTGVTCVIDQNGSFTDPADPTFKRQRKFLNPDTGDSFLAGSFAAKITLENTPPVTIYARVGDLFSISLGLLALVSIFLQAKPKPHVPAKA